MVEDAVGSTGSYEIKAGSDEHKKVINAMKGAPIGPIGWK